MGFCLFQQFEEPGDFLAVNAAQIEDLSGFDHDSVVMTKLIFYGGTSILVRGTKKDVMRILMEGAKVGINALEVHTFNASHAFKPGPIKLSKPDTVLYVKEVPSHLMSKIKTPNIVTASSMHLDNKKDQLITERPGTFAARANAKGKVPTLDVSDDG